MAQSILSEVAPHESCISRQYDTRNIDTNGEPPSPTDELDGTSSPVKTAQCLEICHRLSEDFILYKTKANFGRPPGKYTATLRRVGDEVELKYAYNLNGLVNNLHYDSKKHFYVRQLFNVSLNAMFDTGSINWGRIVMIYVFAARLAQYCKDNGNEDAVDEIVEVCGDYVEKKLTPWIMKQGGWDDFSDKFRAKDWKETATFNSLVVTGAVLGGLAALRFLTK